MKTVEFASDYDSFEEKHFDDYFCPAGSLSSQREYRKADKILRDSEPSKYLKKENISASHFIEYLEYRPCAGKDFAEIRPSSASLCPSPDPKEMDSILSQTQEVFIPNLFDTNFSLMKQLKTSGEETYKSLCENYEKQNKVLREEVQECSREITRLMQHQEKAKIRHNLINQEALKAKRFVKIIMNSIGELLDEKFEIPKDEHSYNLIASQLQLFQSRITRKQSLFMKTKSNLDQFIKENKQLKREISDLSEANSQLTEKVQVKKQKIKDLQKLLAKPVERYSEENDSRAASSVISKSSTPLSEDTIQPKRKMRNPRVLSAKGSPIGEIDCYREALKDLKVLSERAHSKISETKKKLNTIPKSFIGKSGGKPLEKNFTKSPPLVKYYRS